MIELTVEHADKHLKPSLFHLMISKSRSKKSHKALFRFLLILVCLALPMPGKTAVIRVPEQAATLEDAIQISSDGDEIIVAPGTYSGPGNCNLNLQGKRIRVHSELGPENTVFDIRFQGYLLQSLADEGTDRTTVFEGFTIKNAYSSHGAMELNSRIKISKCIFINNMSSLDGGAISGRGSPWIAGCLFHHNSAENRGGAIAFRYGSPLIDRCTFYGNQAEISGNSIYLDHTKTTILNSIVWDLLPVSTHQSRLACLYSCIHDNIPASWITKESISSDPRFTDPENGDFSLTAGSPCIDTGDPFSRNDSDESRADMGCEHYGGNLPANVLGGMISGELHNGSLPNIITEDLVIEPGRTLIINQGTQLLFRNGSGLLCHGTLYIVNNGGPYACCEPQINEAWFGGIRAIKASRINISGLVLKKGAGHFGGGYYGFGGSHTIWRTIVENCWAGSYGGGLHFRNAQPTLLEITVHDNDALGIENIGGRGGGISFRSSDAILFIGHIYNNTAICYGAGIYSDYFSHINASYINIFGNTCLGDEAGISAHHVDIYRCHFTRNKTFGSGGGLWCLDGNVVNCRFSENEASSFGGGFWTDNAQIALCLIEDNSAQFGGGTYCPRNTQAKFFNCTFTNNTAWDGGAVFIDLGASPEFVDCILWNNLPPFKILGNPMFAYCDIENGAGYPWFGEGCIDSDPLLINGPSGFGYLSQIISGQINDSPCLDSGSDLAARICFEVGDLDVCLDDFTTRTDHVADARYADIGYHFPRDIRPTPTMLPTNTPKPTQTPLPTSTPTPTPTSTVPPSCGIPLVRIDMPASFYQPNDECWITLCTCQPEISDMPADVFCVLQVGEMFFFYPSWSTKPDFKRLLIPPYWDCVTVIPPFQWPGNAGSGRNATLWAFFMDPLTKQVISNIGCFDFSW
ncbi:hypothetical protein JW979_04690 [bacterium]|nr:hypothetical protein [candidate division CSSED10-310 bacterium]